MTLIGDPTLLGWSITLLELLACGLAVRIALSSRDSTLERRLFFALFALIYGLLAINKQLDLQVPITDLGRRLARAQGWYPYREIVQAGFLAGLTVVVTLLLLLLVHLAQPLSLDTGAALVGLSISAIFLVLRSASFEVFDMRTLLGGLNIYPPLELTGALVTVGAGLVAILRRHRAEIDPPLSRPFASER